jgi:hypothetical protein
MLRYPNNEAYSGLEVRYLAPLPPQTPPPPLNSQVPAHNSLEKHGWRTKRKLWLAFAMIGVIAIVAAVVGGVVGGLSASGKCCGRSGGYGTSPSDVEGGILAVRWVADEYNFF